MTTRINDDSFTASMQQLFNITVHSYDNELVLHEVLFSSVLIDTAVRITYWHLNCAYNNKHVRNHSVLYMPLEVVSDFLGRLFVKQMHTDSNYNIVKNNWDVLTISPNSWVYKYDRCYAFVEIVGEKARVSIQRI